MSGVHKVRLGELLVRAGRLTEQDLEQALAVQKASGKGERLGRVLEELGMCSEEDTARALSAQLEIPYVPPHELVIDDESLKKLGLSFCREAEVVPCVSGSHFIHLAMSDPLGIQYLDRARHAIGQAVYPAATTRSGIARAVGKSAGESDNLATMVQEARERLDSAPDSEEGLESSASSAPAVRLVNEILTRAVLENASDVHLDPRESRTDVRYRIDGTLRTVLTLPRDLHETVTARIKIISDLNIMDRRAPQDGHADFRVGDRSVDLRVSTLPTTHGEKSVLRILGSHLTAVSLTDLGIADDQLALLRQATAQPQGCVVVTGPTGSGKSSTLIACLQEVANEALNITTIEDPVEREVPGVSHAQVNELAGLTFATGLRSLLRQDPDVIMVGEIRDSETAEIAMRASLTGHLILTTVHANHALAAVTRLRDMGIEDFLLSSALTLVLAQRLARKICPLCREPAELSVLERNLVSEVAGAGEPAVAFQGRGCDRCGGRGTAGRIAISETIPFSQELQTLVAAGAGELDLAAQARREGARWMFEDGLSKVATGLVSIGEVVRAVPLPRYRGEADARAATGTPDDEPVMALVVDDDEYAEAEFATAKPSAERAELERFVRALTRIPTLPDAVVRLTEVIQDENASAADAAKVVETDPGLAAKLLRLVNSPAHGLVREVRSVTQAVAYLGLGQVWSVCVGAGVMESLGSFNSETLPFTDIWSHSLGVAVISRELSRASGGIDPGHAYLAGLLHDVGKVLLGTYVPSEFDRCVRAAEMAGSPLWQVEQTYLGFTHSAVAQWLLDSWRLPAPVVQAVALHHAPVIVGEDGNPVAEPRALLVCLADDIAKVCGLGRSGDPTAFADRSRELASLGLTEAQAEAAGQAARRSVDDALTALAPN